MKIFLRTYAISLLIVFVSCVALLIVTDSLPFGKYLDYSGGDYVRGVSIPFVIFYSFAQLFFYVSQLALLIRTKFFRSANAEKYFAILLAVFSVQISSFALWMEFEDQLSLLLPQHLFLSAYIFFGMRGNIFIIELLLILIVGFFLVRRNLKTEK